ncbi:unnamed protein product [Effrenium voratum]|nr:unnamed protein product [Effrenium voratum]
MQIASDAHCILQAEVQEIFSYLDLDGSGRLITYTEFCAAGLGEDGFQDEHVLWSAFKTFDIHDDGQISKEELRQVLQRADITQVWTANVCEEVAQEVVQVFGSSDGDSINFEEWLDLMRECSARHNEVSPRRFSQSLATVLQDAQASFALGAADEESQGSQEETEVKALMPNTEPVPAASARSSGGYNPMLDMDCCGSGLRRIYRTISGRREIRETR